MIASKETWALQGNLFCKPEWVKVGVTKKIVVTAPSVVSKLNKSGFIEKYPRGAHGGILIVTYNAKKVKVVNGIVTEK